MQKGPNRALTRTFGLLTLTFGLPWSAGSLGAQTPSSPAPEPVIRWSPDRLAQGRLFRLVVEGGGSGALSDVQGSVAGERLHMEEGPDGSFLGLAAVPVDADTEVSGTARLRYRSGVSETVEFRIPVEAGAFEHEELTVAPRYGSPPSEEERARRARDVAKARAVSEAAHRTPRLWDESVEIPRRDRVTSGFGNGRVFNGQVSSRHMGLDLDGETGDTIYAAARGVVELVDTFVLAGNIVYLNHGSGLVSGYFHLDEQLVAEGDTVVAGTPIGRVGATGRVTGPHLHWVVRYGHTSVDPRSLLEVVGGEGGSSGG
ncbi:MAG: M23 family metallopeptidase [Gemmatimonadota bacterium]|jgi:murein DD-endopeptidase MepM/ murein hydrolase activator NlpD